MERKKFLKNGLALIGGTAFILESCKKTDIATDPTGTDSTTGSSDGSCFTTASETEGPYPYPGGEINNPLDRTDITENKSGVPLTLTFNIVDVNDKCAALAGARFDIWHCDKDGNYSVYGSYQGQTFLRGYQTADANGQVVFQTIYPGWYQGRATHIHFEIYVNDVMKVTSQMTFPDATSDIVHTSALYTKGVNPTRITGDNIFNNSATDLANETIAVTGDITNGYAGSLTVGLKL